MRTFSISRLFGCHLAAVMVAAGALAAPVGYYRQPALSGSTLVFVAEGDLWKVPVTGGVARRLTSHPGGESSAAISPDGKTLAFIAAYEGPAEVYTMPLDGGRPVRRTYGIGGARVVGWSPAGEVLVATALFSTLPNTQLVALDVSSAEAAGRFRRVPLEQAADGSYDADGSTLFFTRLPFQGSHTKRYQGGTAQNIWSFTAGDAEAVPLTADWPGTSKRPMWWEGRVYFASDRDGTMNLWSMAPEGGDLRQHTHHSGWEVKSPYLEGGRIAYQLQADIRVYDIAADADRATPITLDSDLDQTRENWVDMPFDYLTAVHLSPDGDRVAMTARGRVFVAPHRQGRLVEATRREGVRYRQARFLPGGDKLLALSDESGEVELWSLDAAGVAEPEQLTDDGEALRWEGVPSPDGRWIAHTDKNQRLFVYDLEGGDNRLVAESQIARFRDLVWSPDSRWLAYVASDANMFDRIWLYDVDSETRRALTSDRFDSFGPAWSPDGKWLYLLSDRNLSSVVGSPWGNYQPEPYLDKKTRVYQIALVPGLRSPFAPETELDADNEKEDGDEEDENGDEKEDGDVTVSIDFDGIQRRLVEVPVEPGNYFALEATEKTLFWLSRAPGERESELVALEIEREDPKPETVTGGVRYWELSLDQKKILVRKEKALYIFDAKAAKADLENKEVGLSAWRLSVVPREEWRQMFVEAWRLERDYFYDRGMHGVDWKAMLDKYLPLVDRVTNRAELSDLLAQMVSELSALHIFVYGGDHREGEDDVVPASLGAVLERDQGAGGYRVAHIYRSDPDQPGRVSPLARPDVRVEEGEVIAAVNGRPTLAAPDIGALLRHQAGRQVLLKVRSAEGESRQVIVEPLTPGEAWDLRYHEWEYTRRLAVEEAGGGDIGYVHLRAMGGRNFTEWARDFYPVFNRKGLIVDVRHNRGGNIDSWILGRLLRKAWFYWSQRVGQAPSWNMQYAFRGHVVVLCNERTASDGEAFTEGIRRLEIGKIIGTRTWGGEIWLSASNFLVDRGIATAAEYGVYGPEGEWLIEGWGVEPDIVVDNPPHATFNGEDAQLAAAIEYLKTKIEEEPIPDYRAPEYPDKSLPEPR